VKGKNGKFTNLAIFTRELVRLSKDSNDNLEANTDRREPECYSNDNYTIYRNAGF
jgi:hypothetical protein